MSKQVKNIIVLRNIYSHLFDEIIFVMKKDANVQGTTQPNLVAEARKIVEDYVGGQGESYNSQTVCQHVSIEHNGLERGEKLNVILNIALVVSLVLFVAMVVKAL